MFACADCNERQCIPAQCPLWNKYTQLDTTLNPCTMPIAKPIEICITSPRIQVFSSTKLQISIGAFDAVNRNNLHASF